MNSRLPRGWSLSWVVVALACATVPSAERVPERPSDAPSAEAKQEAHPSRVGRHAANGVKSAIIGLAVGGSLAGTMGAVVGAGAFGLYGVVTGEMPFDPSESPEPEKKRRTAKASRVGAAVTEEQAAAQREIEDEIGRELKRQEERLRELDRRDLENAALADRQREIQIETEPVSTRPVGLGETTHASVSERAATAIGSRPT
jgi:hypothetical protein